MYFGSHLVHGINGLVGEETVVDIPFCQFDTCHNGIVGVVNVVVSLVAVFHVLQNLNGFFGGGGVNNHFLEAALQRTVFLDRITILVERGGSDALDGATGQRGLENVGRVHASWR